MMRATGTVVNKTRLVMSACPPISDLSRTSRGFRYVPESGICDATNESGQCRAVPGERLDSDTQVRPPSDAEVS